MQVSRSQTGSVFPLTVGYIGHAVMGTAAAECCEERPGDGASPGACATDQITPERPEERLPARQHGGSVELAKIKFERSERARGV